MPRTVTKEDQRIALDQAKELLLKTDLGNDEEELQQLVAFGAACYIAGVQAANSLLHVN